MRDVRRHPLGPVLTAMVVLLAVTGGATAQQEESEAAAGRGWIGITFSYDPTVQPPDDAETARPIQIDDVFEGSPADRAGIQPGDSVVSVDGQAVNPESFRRFGAQLRPDQTVRLTLRREGRTREVELEAGERPSLARSFLPPEVVVQLDSLRDALLRRFDSMRIQLRYEPTDAPERARAPDDSSDGPGVRVRPADDEPTARPGGGRDRPVAGRRPPPAPDSAADEPTARAPNPHLLGLSYVAGAQLTALNSGLSEYFGVESGVLVTAVLQETPADEAGLRPGDVVVSVEGTTCSTVECFRRALAQAQDWPASLRVVRKQEEIELGLPR